MTKRLFTLAMMFICAFGAWADDWYGKIDFRSWAAESITSSTLTLSLDGTEINNTGLYLLNNPTANVDGKSDLNLHGRIALTTLTPSNNKYIDIRNNGSGDSSTGLRNYKGAATTLSILDLKEGDRVKIICSEEAVKITPTNSHKVLGKANTKEIIWTSGDIYVMDEDGRLDVSFGDGSSQKYIYSIEITEKPASIVYDFARAESIVINSTGDTNPKLYYGDGSSTSSQSYYSIDTPNTNSRVGWSATTNITKVDGGMKVTSGNRYLAIKNLQLGETIRIGYIGGTLKCALYNNSGTRGDIISKNGTALSAGDVISSNDELTVTNVDDTYNYVVFLPDNNCVISQIYLNSQETVSTPSISTEAGDGETTVTITGGTSSPESNSVKTYYTTDGNDPTTDSNLYTEPFSVSSGCTVKAISISATGTESTTASEEVTVTAISRAITIGTHNNGSLETSVTEATKETIVTITATPNNGYYLSSITITKTEDETQYMKITDGSNTFEMPAYAVTVSATFMRTQYTITYDLNGGSVATDNPTTYDVNTTTFTLTNPIKEGYTFAGWTGTGLDAATTIVTIAKGSTGNREYTATWNQEAPASYDIIVTQPEAGGTVGVKVGNVEVTTANTTATADQIITLSNTPAENYTFSSYSVTKTSGGEAVEVTDGSFIMPAEGVIVTAVFEPTAHVHNFNYAVGTGENTNILTATCRNTGCSLTDSKATLTLTAEGGTYNGSAFSASTNLDAFYNATGLSATVSINYTGDNSYNSADAPTNAGNYTAIATVTIGEGNYGLTKAFVIAQKELTITANAQTVSVGGSITEGISQVTTDGLVEGDELTGITLEASSTEAATESGTITPSNAVIKNGASNYNISYVAGTLTVVAGTQSYNIVVPSTVNGNSVSANPTSATAGTEITLTITTAENYTLASISADNNVELSGSGETRTFTMPAANVTITATWTINQADTGDSGTSETYTVTETGGIEVSSVTTNTNSSSITIPAQVGSTSVTLISNDAFSSITNKSYIKSVDLSATSITGVEVNRTSGVFNGFPEETMIYMPAGNTEASGQKNVVIGGTCSDFVMTDEKSYSIPTSFTATNATLSRSFTSEKYCTLCLPYAIPAGNLCGKIYEFTSIEGTTVKMTEDADGLDANKPYIFVPSAAAEQITTTSVIVNMSATPNTEKTDFTFKGIFGRKEFTSDEISGGVYGFAADSNHGASIGQFVKASIGAWTEGMRAYLAYSGSLSETEVASTRGEGLPDVLNVVLIHANGSTTNIGSLELMTADDGSPVYNLNGQRVDNSYKGLVIKNGKKVVKK